MGIQGNVYISTISVYEGAVVMNFRPCIDLHEGKVKQIVGSTLDSPKGDVVENFVADKDSAYYAEMFKADNLKGGHIIMLGAGNEQATIRAIQAYQGGLQVGGGITNENASVYLQKGASHVIVTSYVFKDGDININNLNKISSEIGKEKLVLDLSCRIIDGVYYVVTNRWQKFTDFEINESNLIELSSYCDEFLLHAVDVEGKKSGIDIALLEQLGILHGINIKITYAGGISSFEDIQTIEKLGKGKIDFTIGSALDIFGGHLKYNDVVKYIT